MEKMGIYPIYKHKVDWEVIKRTSKMCPGQKRKMRSKHMANIGPVGSVLYRRGERESANVPDAKELRQIYTLHNAEDPNRTKNFKNQWK